MKEALVPTVSETLEARTPEPTLLNQVLGIVSGVAMMMLLLLQSDSAPPDEDYYAPPPARPGRHSIVGGALYKCDCMRPFSL